MLSLDVSTSTSRDSALPTFLGIGVQRAATTWLHDCLASHPEVFVAPEKEVAFFNEHFERGLEWYQGRFAPGLDKKARGEFTPLYFHLAPFEIMRRVLPDVRLIVVFREPASRAFSAYRLLHRQFSGRRFDEVCNSSRGKFLIDWSRYADKLSELYDYYPRDQVLVLLYDDVEMNPAGVLKQVYAHIGVASDFQSPCTDSVQNQIVYPAAQRVIASAGLSWAITLVKKTPLGSALKRWHKSRGISLDDQEFIQRMRGMFRDDVLRLQDILNRDLSHWLA